MNRSKNYVFLSHCILAQAARANGLAKIFPAAVKPVIQFCLDNDINMVQMSCPETQCSAGGIGRDPHGKAWYEKNGLRDTASELAIGQARYMKDLSDNGFNILAIIGVEFSPACAPMYLNKGPVVIKDEGIFVEELKRQMVALDLDVRFIGVNLRWHKKMARDLESLLHDEPSTINIKNCSEKDHIASDDLIPLKQMPIAQ